MANENYYHYDLIILGSGPAGCTATIYAAQANLSLALIVGNEQGGQITKASRIINWPGDPEEVSGVTLMERMLRQVVQLKGIVIHDFIEQAELTRYPFILSGTEGTYGCKALIIATGTSPRFLGLAKEQEYLGRGISTCALCDGYFYRGKDVVVIGGGDSMAEDALYLSNIAATVTVVHRSNHLRANASAMEQLKKTKSVRFILSTVVEEFLTDAEGIRGVRIHHLDSGKTQELSAAGVFIAIGSTPNSQIFTGQLAMENGCIKTKHSYTSQTSIRGVFAAGDVVLHQQRQAVIAAGSGCIAALDAKDFLASLK